VTGLGQSVSTGIAGAVPSLISKSRPDGREGSRPVVRAAQRPPERGLRRRDRREPVRAAHDPSERVQEALRVSSLASWTPSNSSVLVGVGQHRRDHAALWCARVRPAQLASLTPLTPGAPPFESARESDRQRQVHRRYRGWGDSCPRAARRDVRRGGVDRGLRDQRAICGANASRPERRQLLAPTRE